MIQNPTRPANSANVIPPHSQSQATQKHTIETITCSICQAIYTPAPLHTAFLAHSPLAMEAAFMEACHFCFRCRRPACPQCWDFVQGVCAECDQEAGLPFRVPVPPLEGLRLPPRYLTFPCQEETVSPFVCLHTGHFQTQTAQLSQLSLSQSSTHRLRTPSPTTSSLPLASAVILQPSPSSQPLSPPCTNIMTASASPTAHSEISPFLVPQSPDTLELQRPLETVPDEEDEDEPDEETSLWKHIEHALIIITILVLLTLIVTITLAQLSTNMNAQIARFLHIDIRAEIAYLLQLIGHIFKR